MNAVNSLQAILVPVLSPTQQRELVRRWQEEQDQAARDQLVRMTIALAAKMAKERDWVSKEFDDAMQNAALNLMIAIDKFDLDTPWNFSTYARHWILKSFGDTISENHAIPSHVALRRKQLKQVEDDAQKKGASPLRAAQVAYDTQTRDDKFRLRHQCNIDDVNEKCFATQPEEKIDVRDMLSSVRDKRQLTILRFNMGLIGSRPWKLAHIGRVMGLTRERVRQLREVALNDIRCGVSR